MEYVRVGTVINTFGIRGELKVRSMTDNPEVRFADGSRLLVAVNGGRQAVEAAGYRVHKGYVLLRLRGLADINAVLPFKGCALYAAVADLPPLPTGHFYYHEILGCQVYQGDRLIGTATAIDDGPQALLKVTRPDGSQLLIPLVPAFLADVDVANRRVQVTLIEGMQ